MRKDELDLHEHCMRLAIEKTRLGMTEGQTPFGALIRRGTEILAVAHNTVVRDRDPTSHAEINAIRLAVQKLGVAELPDCVLYSTCEPCPMCFTASHWAGISHILFGATIQDAAQTGFDELRMPTSELAARGSRIELTPEFLREESLELFREFRKTKPRAER